MNWTRFISQLPRVCYLESLFLVILIFSILLVSSKYQVANATQLYSRTESPFGIPYDTWVSKFWNWNVGLNNSEASPKPDGCLINKSNQVVFLMDTALPGIHNQVCNISSKQGLLVPLWIGWCDTGGDISRIRNQSNLDVELSKCARETYDLGKVRSVVRLDGKQIANLDERLYQPLLSLLSGKLTYQVNSMKNVTEFYSKAFNLHIPDNTWKSGVNAGDVRAGTHGWWVFLKPLSPGKHELFYNVDVEPVEKGVGRSPGVTTNHAANTYVFNVR